MAPMAGSDGSHRLSSGMTPKKRPVMEEMVDDVKEYEALDEPGVLQSEHLGPNIELYLFTLPTAILDPMKLINCEMTLNSVKDRKVRMGDQKYSIVNYPTNDLPPLYLPSEDGVLRRKGGIVIKSHVVLRGEAQVQQEQNGGGSASEGTRTKGYVDLNSLRSTTHLPPSDIQPRDFLANSRNTASPGKATSTEKKPQKKRKREADDGEEPQSPKVKKRKWEIHGKELLTSPNTPQARKPEGYVDDNTGSPVHLVKGKNKKTTSTTTPNKGEQATTMEVTPREKTSGSPSKTKIKKEKMEAALSASQNTTTDDVTQEKKKKKKSAKRNNDSLVNPSIALKMEKLSADEETPQLSPSKTKKTKKNQLNSTQ